MKDTGRSAAEQGEDLHRGDPMSEDDATKLLSVPGGDALGRDNSTRSRASPRKVMYVACDPTKPPELVRRNPDGSVTYLPAPE